MTRIAYLDIFSGISGDMTLGALVAVGVDFDELRRGLAGLGVEGWSLEREAVERSGIAAVKVHLRTDERARAVRRRLSDVEKILAEGGLPEPVAARALAVFRRLAEAEARVHSTSVDEVHFHETGAVDAIVDVAGAALGFHLLGIDEIHASPVALGTGFVEAAHGLLPVPAPATVEILKGVPVRGTGVEAELTTPTGAAIAATLARSFGPAPEMRIEAVGYGAGSRELADRPNLLRLMVGESAGVEDEADTVFVIETNIDDATPEAVGYLMERALEAGARDVFAAGVTMKKSRPGTLVTVLASPDRRASLEELMLAESTTFGLRTTVARRRILAREIVTVETPLGPVRAKVGRLDGRVLRVSAEYEDVREIARRSGLAFASVVRRIEPALRELEERR